MIILQNLIKAYYKKSGKSNYDRKLTELDVETTRIRSRVNGVLVTCFDDVMMLQLNGLVENQTEIRIYYI